MDGNPHLQREPAGHWQGLRKRHRLHGGVKEHVFLIAMARKISLEPEDEAASRRERNHGHMVVCHTLKTGVQADTSRARHQQQLPAASKKRQSGSGRTDEQVTRSVIYANFAKWRGDSVKDLVFVVWTSSVVGSGFRGVCGLKIQLRVWGRCEQRTQK